MLLFELRVEDPRPAWLRESGGAAVISGAQRATRASRARGWKYQGLHVARGGATCLDAGDRRWADPARTTLEPRGPAERNFAEVTRELPGREQPQLEADYTAQARRAGHPRAARRTEPPTAII